MLKTALKSRSISENQLSPHLQNRLKSGVQSVVKTFYSTDSQISSNVVDYEGLAGNTISYKDGVKFDTNGKIVKTTSDAIGFALNSGILNEKIKIRIVGAIKTTDNSFSSFVGKKVFLINGVMRVLPFTLNTNDYLQEVGSCPDANTFIVDLKTCYKRS